METTSITLSTIADLDVVVDKDLAIAVFTQGGLDTLKDELQAQLDAFEPDVSTLAGREACKAFAFKFAKDKALVDEIGKKLIEDEQNTVKSVQANLRDWRAYCDDKRKAARAPLTAYEAEAKAKKAEEARLAQEEADRKEQQRVDALAALKKTRVALLLSILGDDYDADDFETWGIGDKTNEEFEVILKDARDQAKKDKDEAEAEAKEKAEAERLQQILETRTLILTHAGLSDAEMPEADTIIGYGKEEFLAIVKKVKDDAAAAQAEYEKEQLGEDRLASLMAVSYTAEYLSGLNEQEWSEIQKQDRDLYASNTREKAERETEERRRNQVWEARCGALNRLDGCNLELDRSEVVDMSEEDWQALYSAEVKKIEDRNAEIAKRNELFDSRRDMLREIEISVDATDYDYLTSLTETEWTEFYQGKAKAKEEEAAEKKRQEDEAKAAEEAHVEQVEQEAGEDLLSRVMDADTSEDFNPLNTAAVLLSAIKDGRVRHVTIKY